MTAAAIGALAFLRALKPWQIMAAALAMWTGIVSVKAYRAGGQAVIVRAQEQSKKAAVKSTKAHDAAKTPGAAERLRKDACRDC